MFDEESAALTSIQCAAPFEIGPCIRLHVASFQNPGTRHETSEGCAPLSKSRLAVWDLAEQCLTPKRIFTCSSNASDGTSGPTML
jgi:hypothetical protein